PQTCIRCRHHRAVRAVVHHLSPVVPRPGRDDGRAWRQGRPFDDPEMGDPRYFPEFEKRWSRFSKAVGTSWRVDETYISIKAKWHYLYRAVDKHGKTVDFLLRRDRGIDAAQAFFRKALASNAPRVPRKVTLDGHVPTRRALWLLRRGHRCWRNLKVRT